MQKGDRLLAKKISALEAFLGSLFLFLLGCLYFGSD